MLFPTSEPKIKRFCDRMIDGLFWHQPDFPHVNRISLTIKRLGYIVTKKVRAEAKSQKLIATKVKNERLSELVKVMHNCLKKSEVDVAANPKKLKQIGWLPKDKPKPSEIPHQPLNLRISFKDGQSIQLKWDRPDDNTRVRNYIIERRQQSGDWQPVSVSYRTETSLTNQPVKISLEYRIKAVNLAGESLPSNTVRVIL